MRLALTGTNILVAARTSGLVSSQDVENLECYGVVANPKYFFNLKIALVDSSYFDYQVGFWRSLVMLQVEKQGASIQHSP